MMAVLTYKVFLKFMGLHCTALSGTIMSSLYILQLNVFNPILQFIFVEMQTATSSVSSHDICLQVGIKTPQNTKHIMH